MANKVLLIRNAAASDFGGAERIPAFISKELLSYDLDPIILSRSKKTLDFAHSMGIKTKKTWWWPRQNWSGWRVGLFPIYFIWQIILVFYYIALFKRLQPVTIHIQSKDDFIAATYAAKFLGIHCFWSDYADLKHIWRNLGIWYKNPIGKLVYRAAKIPSSIIVVSQKDLEEILVHLPDKDSVVAGKLKVIYNGVYDTLKPAKQKFTFISTARLVVDKGIHELIEAFKQVIVDHPNATLAIIGDGPDRQQFEQLAKSTPGITFFGHQIEPLRYLFESAIFILPTYHEGFSIALLEACMASKAIIATNVGGNPELIEDGVDGLLIPPKDTTALKKAMEKLLNSSTLQKKLSANARKKFLNHYNFGDIVKNHLLPLYKGETI